MTDTTTPPMTPEQRAVLVAELRLPWFTNGCEWYQVRAANSLEADGVTIATLTAERDAAQAEIEALQRELRATVAERNRAQKDCELIVKRFTPKPIRFAPRDRMIIGVERPPQEERTFFYDLIWCPDREDFVSPLIRSLNGATHYLDPRNMIGIVWPREVAAIKKGAAT